MGSNSQEQHALLTDYDTTTAYSQAFYTLFANMRFHWESKQPSELSQWKAPTPPVHTLLVAAASVYKDQATIAANLAIVAAQSGAEIILVDADLRAPSIVRRFGLAQTVGLSDLLEAKEIVAQKLESCLQPTFVPGLRVLGCGTVAMQGTNLLLSSRLEEVANGLRTLLATTTRSSGIVLFHSASVLSAVDASLIGALADQTVLTVVSGQTTRENAKKAQEQLQQAHIKLAGVIMLHQ